MRIYVHSKGRSALQNGTLSWLQPLWGMTHIVCPLSCMSAYKERWPGVGVVGVPDSLDLPEVMDTIAHGIAPTMGAKKFIMMDDDLRFAMRVRPDSPQLHSAAGNGMIAMMYWFDQILNTTAHATITARQGNNQYDGNVSYVGSARSVLAFRGDVLSKHNIRFNRVPSKSDYDATLQLLRLGYRNAINSHYAHDQVGGPTLPGGCTESRTEDVHRNASETLHALHPDYVRITLKQKPDWAFARHDVVVSWKKAYASAAPTNPVPLITRKS